MFRLAGLLAIIPATVLLTISFFVLLALRKAEAAGLKAFGYVIAALLWVGVLLVLSMGSYTLSTGRCPMKEMMKCQMKGMMMDGKAPMPMMQGKADAPMMKR
ncbi:MAG: hypothetical protein WC723_01630 [Candidatus Omnitrophota bacterium]